MIDLKNKFFSYSSLFCWIIYNNNIYKNNGIIIYKKMGEDVKKYIQEGIYFSNDIMDVIEDVSQRYQEHISVSMEIGHFDEINKYMMKLSKALIRYNKQYSGLIRDYREERVLENEKRGLETITEE